LRGLNIPDWYEQIIAPHPMTGEEYEEWNREISKKLTPEQKAFLRSEPVDVPFEM
jgi:hypothetical protein